MPDHAIRQLIAIKGLGCLLTVSHCAVVPPRTDWPSGLRPDYVKLDPVELDELMSADNVADKLQSTVQKLHAANVHVIAPQVEHADALAVIWSSGVDYAQGFYQSHPEMVLSSDE